MILSEGDWSDEGIFVGPTIPKGYRIWILAEEDAQSTWAQDRADELAERIEKAESPLEPIRVPWDRIPTSRPKIQPKPEDGMHACGGQLHGPVPDLPCPNCGVPFFPVFKLDMRDERLKPLGLWPEKVLQIPVCVSCPFMFEPHWFRFHETGIDVLGGVRGDQSRFIQVKRPYESRPICLTPLRREDYPLTEQTRLVESESGVLHQIGGLPVRWGDDHHQMMCPGCEGAMHFAGVVDYDADNVPMFADDGEPIALIIGDCDSLFCFTCPACQVLGMQFVT